MEQRSSTVATMRATKGLAALSRGAAEVRSGTLMGGEPTGPSLGVVPGHRLGRQATLAKGFRLMQPPAALPLFDVSVAVIDSLNLMRASIEEEVVMQSTLGVPAHHALACRLEAYGTPFGAPGLQAVVEGELTEDDKQFAACLAAPPDFDGFADPSFSLQRMASVSALTQPRAGPGGAPALVAGGEKQVATGNRAAELLRMPSIHSDKKKKANDLGTTGDGRSASDAGSASLGMQPSVRPDVSTPEGRAAVAAAAAAARAARPWQLIPGTRDAVAALVGAGYLLLHAVRFDARAPRALGQLNTGLRQRASITMPSGQAASFSSLLAGG